MQLDRLLSGVELRAPLRREPAGALAGLHYDSRQIQPGQAFVAIRGEVTDGNRYIPQALARGAAVVVSEAAPAAEFAATPWVQVADARRALATMAANWFGRPAERLRLIGITGTNGKTTTAYLCESMLAAAGLRAGMISTIEYRAGGEVWPAPHTTPESYDLQAIFARMAEAGCQAVVMEVSSHALAMERTWGCRFEAAVFTNLTQDHLDFHATLDAYRTAKKRLFDGTGAGQPRHAVINADDASGGAMVRDYEGPVLTYGLDAAAGLRATNLVCDRQGVRFRVQGPEGLGFETHSRLLGRVNVSNLLAAIGAGLRMGIDPETVRRGVEAVTRVPGRFERVEAGQPFTVVVDYAHTPDALANVLRLAREQADGGRVIAMFGCGGDRDRGKRPQMGAIAARLSDLAVVTSDNPRSEDPRAILEEILAGIPAAGQAVQVEPDRRAAIGLAIAAARPGDVVVLAGKGHENYQIIGERRNHFDDVEEARAALRAIAACS